MIYHETIYPETLNLEQLPNLFLAWGQRIETLINTPKAAEYEKPLNVKEAAEFTDLEEPTIYSLVQKRLIPFHKPGKKLYFYASELNNWIKGNWERGNTIEAKFLEANTKKGLIQKNKI